jgi:single-strand DNA-binding protein
MASFNKVMLMGNLTRDPDLKFLPSQTACVEFGIACNRKFRTAAGEDKEEVTFVDVTSFGKQAEVINQYFQKGKPIFIEGRLKFDSWEDKQGGGKRSKLTVVIENFQFVGGKDQPEQSHPPEENQAAERRRPAPSQRPQQRERATIPEAFVPEVTFKDADIPFAWCEPSRWI